VRPEFLSRTDSYNPTSVKLVVCIPFSILFHLFYTKNCLIANDFMLHLLTTPSFEFKYIIGNGGTDLVLLGGAILADHLIGVGVHQCMCCDIYFTCQSLCCFLFNMIICDQWDCSGDILNFALLDGFRF
jgi:hypothetical protein